MADETTDDIQDIDEQITDDFGAGLDELSQPEPETASASLVELFRTNGLEVEGDTDEDALAYLQNAVKSHRTLPELQEKTRLYEQLVPYAHEHLRNQHAPKPQPEPETPKQEVERHFKWDMPDFDPEMLHDVTQDPATGKWIPRSPNVRQEVADAVNKFYTTAQKRQMDFIRDPEGTLLRPYMQDYERTIEEKMNQLVEKRLTEHQTKQQLQAWAHQNSNWLYVTDENNQVLVDHTGQGIPSEAGKAFNFYTTKAHEMGVGRQPNGDVNPFAILQYAEDMTRSYLAQQTPPDNGNAQATKEKVDRAVRAPSRAGTVKTAMREGTTQDSQDDISEMLDRAMQQHGLLTQ